MFRFLIHVTFMTTGEFLLHCIWIIIVAHYTVYEHMWTAAQWTTMFSLFTVA